MKRTAGTLISRHPQGDRLCNAATFSFDQNQIAPTPPYPAGYRPQRLPAGDYCLDDAWLFERKTLADLAASIKDGRLFEQALRLAKGKPAATLILEGSTRDLASSAMRVEAIRGA